MAEATTTRELFLSELGDIYFAEQKLASKMLPQLKEEARDPELQRGFEHHLEQTRGHCRNVERVFELMGEKAKAEECQGIEGLEKEHKKHSKHVADDIQDLFNCGAAARTEHYEIAAYNGLCAMAEVMGETEALDLLRDNLREEEETLHQVEEISRRLSRQFAHTA